MTSNRILSIDIFRGMTIFIMVFVNDLAGVTGIPLWMKHAAADADSLTFVDVVFPAFLFIVGITIPLALRTRLARGESHWEIGKHILIRAFGLVILGVFMVNSEEMNTQANLIPKSWWDVLLYTSAILIWNQYPKVEGNRRYLFRGLQLTGAITLVVLGLLYRKGEGDHLIGMTTSWWGILGLIGWAYLLSVIVFLVFRNYLIAMVAMLGLFILAVVGLKSEALYLPPLLTELRSQSGLFAHASITLAGIIFSMLFLETIPERTYKERINGMLVMGVFFLAAGFFLRPINGISKIYATPSWALYSIAICCFLFPFIYRLVDVKGITRWASFLKPAGINPLLTYILPYIFYAIFGLSYLSDAFNEGFLGILRSTLFSFFILGIAAFFTKRRIRLGL